MTAYWKIVVNFAYLCLSLTDRQSINISQVQHRFWLKPLLSWSWRRCMRRFKWWKQDPVEPRNTPWCHNLIWKRDPFNSVTVLMLDLAVNDFLIIINKIQFPAHELDNIYILLWFINTNICFSKHNRTR